MDALSALKMVVAPQTGAGVTNPLQDLNKSIPLTDLQKLTPASVPQTVDSTPAGGSFQNVLGNFVREVSDKQAAANDAVNGLLTGQNVSLHQAMISMQEASLSFQLMTEVRNKLLDSYQELMRMQI